MPDEPYTTQQQLNSKPQQQQQQQQQNQFQSSISCGQFEFYVQLTFEKPFKGLVYAYKTLKNIDNQQQQQQQQQHGQQQQQYYGNYYYPIEILDSCTIRGNGESIIYLELSFLSECVEKLLTINLDGFNFRRALLSNNNNKQQLNISNDDLYQLSLYIQNDPKIEQKYDSKIFIQCSSKLTKNILFEQNSNQNDYYYRKIDDNQQSNINPDGDASTNGDNDGKKRQEPYAAKVSQSQQQLQQRSIMPSANLTITTIYDYYQQQQQQIEQQQQQSNNNNNNNNQDKIDITNLIESRMDILRGRIPFLKLIDNNVELGDDVTLIIRSRQLGNVNPKIYDYDSRISTCYAYDEQDTMRYELTNQDGCPVDSTVMQSFKIMHNVGTESKVYYTTFPAFKFPGSQYLNIQCTLLVCRQICPTPTCDHHHNQQQHPNRNGW
uniref:Myb-like protein AA n=1 Tax=Dermatophagoides pteronyssinus TaxID=6956 RepID=A0A6P6XU82_DERPT|nr:myb-like protein AA [Dermatophagoides pteronyssinus]